jgi:DNA-directed RNA polymerase subunit RPC12/RpoP
MTEMTKIPQPEIEAYHAGYQAGYENGKRDAVRHAYNKCEEYPTLFECSACGEDCDDTVPWDHTEIEYCPHCGAKIIDEMEYKMLYHSAFPNGKETDDAEVH